MPQHVAAFVGLGTFSHFVFGRIRIRNVEFRALGLVLPKAAAARTY